MGEWPWPQPCFPTEPRVHSYLKPLYGLPSPSPHCSLEFKKKKKQKKKGASLLPGVKETVYLKAHRLSGLCCYHWTLSLAPPPAHTPALPREEARG